MTILTQSSPRITKSGKLSQILSWAALPGAVLALIVLGALLSDQFLTVKNLTNVLINMSIVGIIVVGMTFVFITRGMADLSVPATVAVGGILALGLQPSIGSLPAALVGVLAATLAGTLNGILIGFAGLNPVITTLATGIIVLGIAQAAVGGVIVYGDDKVIQQFLTGRLLGTVPVIVLIFLAIAIAGHLLLSRSTLGRWTYAVGSNPHATKASAVPVRFTKASAFILTGGLAGFAGVLLGLTLQTARPGIGMGYEFDAITAVVLGGVSLLGGFGSIPRAIGGLLIIQILGNILVLQGVPTQPQGLVKGALIVGAVAVDVALRKKGGTR